MARRSMEHLLADVRFALDRGMTARDLVPMLTQLMRVAPGGSEVSRFARLELGRQLLAKEPFRAAGLARSILKEQDDDEAFGLLGVALTLLGCYQAAARAHRRAHCLAPRHPGHAHNLGHLLDAGFGSPDRALPWLRRAFDSAPDVPGIASSYAHALVGVGRVEEAHAVLCKHGRLDAEAANEVVEKWLSAPSSERDSA